MWSHATQGARATGRCQLLLRQPACCCSNLLGVELLPMMLLASQELSARAATHDQHLTFGAQPFVPEITSKIWVLTWQRPLKTLRAAAFCIVEYDCWLSLAGP